jgi:hypothetical protein
VSKKSLAAQCASFAPIENVVPAGHSHAIFRVDYGFASTFQQAIVTKRKPSADMQDKNEANLGQKEARIEKEKTSELTRSAPVSKVHRFPACSPA